jgi:cobaltochelatase CobS
MPTASFLSLDEFRDKIEESRVTCALCGRREHSLIRHLRDRHNLSLGQYRKQHPQAEVTSRILNELSRQIARTAQTTDDLEAFLPSFVATNTPSLFDQLKTQFPACKAENVHLIPAIIPEFILEQKVARAAAFALLKGKNTYVEGPTGCGKTDAVKQIHAQLGRPMKRVNANGDITAANFVGSKQVDVTTGSFFKHGNLPLAMRGGYTLLIDEIDYMPPNIAAVLNPVLEGARELYLPETNEHIVAAPGFCIFATANTGGKGDSSGVYNGTEVLNTAFLDRFAVKLKMDYLDAPSETEMLLKRFSHQGEAKLHRFVLAAREVREQFKNGVLPVTLSTRKLIELFEMEAALGMKEAVNCAILNWLDEDNIAVVKKILDNRGISLL